MFIGKKVLANKNKSLIFLGNIAFCHKTYVDDNRTRVAKDKEEEEKVDNNKKVFEKYHIFVEVCIIPTFVVLN